MNPDTKNPNPLNRRQFLERLGKAGISVTAACAAGFWFYDPKGPAASGTEEARPVRFDFSVKGLEPKMSIVEGEDRTATLRMALKGLGGIETFIQKGDRVLLKVNAAFATPPMLSATTHPDLVTAMAELCYGAGAASVVVTDNPINDPASCFTLTGIEEAARKAGAKVVLPRDDLFTPMTLKNGKLIRNWPVLYKPLENITKVIGMAPVKDHHRSGASMTMKNWYGLLGGRRNIFHQDINASSWNWRMMIKPSFVVLDGTKRMMTQRAHRRLTFGPQGYPHHDRQHRSGGRRCIWRVLTGKISDRLPFIAKAEAAGVGTADYKKLNPVMASIMKSQSEKR